MTAADHAQRGDSLRMPSSQGLVRAALAAALDGAAELLGAARIAVLLTDSSGALRPAARRGFTAADVQSLTGLLGSGHSADNLAAGRPLAQGAGDPLPPELASWLSAHGERALIAAPLSWENRVPADPGGSAPPPDQAVARRSEVDRPSSAAVSAPPAPVTMPPTLGGILVLGFDPPARITGVRVSAVERFAALTAIAIGAARRAAGAERRTPLPAADAPAAEQPVVVDERQTALAQALTDVVAATVAVEDVAEASEAAAQILLRALPGIDIVNVWVLDDEGGGLRRIATIDSLGVDMDAPAHLPLDEPVGAARALQEQRVIVWQGDETAWPERVRDFARRRGLSTVLHVPMQSSGRTTGVLTLASRSAREYAPSELGFLGVLAGQLGGQLEVVRGRQRAEAERRRLLSLIETLPEGLLIMQPDGRVSLFNQAAVDIFGREPLDESWDDRMRSLRPRTPDGRLYAIDEIPLVRALNGETVRALEFVIRREDGADVPLLVSAGPVRGQDGAVTAAISIFQDITPLKELDRLKDEFVNTVSHELRTPTTTIRGGALTLLKRGDRLDEETRRQLLQDIAEESERLHHLVEDLLTLTRSRSGMIMAPEPVRLHRLVNKVILDLGGRLGSYPLTVDVPANLPVVEADPVALEQVLRNLTENAVQHSPRGARVEITAVTRGEEVVVSVLDHGDGLTPEDLDRVFEPFYRAPATIRSGAQGAGLGLAVCRRLVEMHGGRIWAENRPAGGAAFRFTLPVAREEEE